MPTFQTVSDDFRESLELHSKEIHRRRVEVIQELNEKFGLNKDGELAWGIARLLVPFNGEI